MPFSSHIEEVGTISFPSLRCGPLFRIMMMPVVVGDPKSLPVAAMHSMGVWMPMINKLFKIAQQLPKDIVDSWPSERIGYLTIDEKVVNGGRTHRRPGLHVDGWYGMNGSGGSWGGGGAWAKNGMLTTSDFAGCRAWNQMFEGEPGPEGDCSHLASQCRLDIVLESNVVYWMNNMCVHESLPMPCTLKRIFARLSLPSNAAWYEGYTENPIGIKPSGPVLPRRAFMDYV